MQRVNVLHGEFEFEEESPAGYRSGAIEAAKRVGASEQSVSVFLLPPGEAVCPYHYEYVEEWLLVFDGAVSVRAPDETVSLRRGDLVCFPAGRDGAHRVANEGGEPALILMWSSAREPSVAVYPDSDKIGVWPGDLTDKIMVHRKDGKVDYWEGEA